jgi:hypothetical protein
MQGTTLSRAAYFEASAQVGSTSSLVPLTWGPRFRDVPGLFHFRNNRAYLLVTGVSHPVSLLWFVGCGRPW